VDAIVSTAADLGRWVMSHAHGAEGIKRAVRAGVRSIDHGTFLDDESIGMMLDHGTWLVPTLTAGDTTEEMANDPKISESVREKLRGLGRPELDAFRRAAQAGVKIAMGTDCPVAPHGTNLRELQLMAENSFTPMQALVAATSSAAELMGLSDEVGTIGPGQACRPRRRQRGRARSREAPRAYRGRLQGRGTRRRLRSGSALSRDRSWIGNPGLDRGHCGAGRVAAPGRKSTW
jgi:imidazolonepropionase-like amidohydrolase